MKRRPARDTRQLVILTGLSGSGKSTVLKTFEDLGFYCVDNLPVALIPTFSELHMQAGGQIQRAALLVDAREGGQLEQLPAILRQLRAEQPATLVFIDASEEALLRRFSETRRPHPLGHDRPVLEGLQRERGELHRGRAGADDAVAHRQAVGDGGDRELLRIDAQEAAADDVEGDQAAVA
ncbi:MAG: hypothetical protein LAO19_21915, partial [Acidobacteriia bacterium]|nr:hypothetical protein [Terriglobia bacterium]